MGVSLKRLLGNKIYVYLQLSTILSIFGFNSYWVYLPKYIEIQYKKSASAANFATGSVSLVFVALGILLGAIIVQKFKPRARYMVIWNTVTDFSFLVGIIIYSFLGCPAADNQTQIFENGPLAISFLTIEILNIILYLL